MIKYSVLIFFCLHLIFSESIIAQGRNIFDQIENTQDINGKVKIIQDDNIKSLVDQHLWTRSKDKGIIGYRIRIFSDSGADAKKEFEYTKASFSEHFGEIKIHQEFSYPFYKIYVGDFRNRSEALKVLRQIEKRFPDAFIVQSRINYPNLNKE